MSGCIFSHHLGTGSLDAVKVLQIAVALFKKRSLFFPNQLFLPVRRTFLCDTIKVEWFIFIYKGKCQRIGTK